MDCKMDSIIGVNKMIKLTHEPEADIPTARSGHRAVASDGYMWVLGGYNPDNAASPLYKEIWRLNVTTGQWDQMKYKGSMPDELASHSTLYDKGYMLVFGGTGYPFGENSSNKLSLCNLQTGEWRTLKCSGDCPDEKYGQAMVLYGRKLYVYGGTSGYLYNTDLHEINLETLVWRKVVPNNVWSEVPPDRYRHEIALYGDNMFVLGGGTSNMVNSLEVLHTFNFTTEQWTCQTTKPDNSTARYPKPRRCHSCVQLKEEAIISGGYDGRHITDDVWKINLRTMQWTRITAMTEPVYFHSAAITPEGCMYIFGGVSSIEHNARTDSCYRLWIKLPTLQTLCWRKLVTSYPQILILPHKKLIKLGVHRNLISRLRYPDGA